MFHPALSRKLFKLTIALAVVCVCSMVATRDSRADEQTAIKIRRTITLDPVGNANVRLTLTAPTNIYTVLKAKTPNIAVLLRKLGAGRHWALMEKIDGSFLDMQNCVDIHYTQRGVARSEHGNQWSITFDPGTPPDLVDIHGTTAIYEATGGSELGTVSAIIRVECPEGSTNLKNNVEARSFTFEFEPKVAGKGAAAASFSVENKEAIMSCLAKCYSNDRFSFLWAARSRFDNTGSATLADYRVRFRIAGFTSWSEWHHAGKVYPGQTVVNAFYPVFDFDKVNGLAGSRPAMLEVEYEYRRPDGEKVSDSDSRRLDILGTNQTIFSGLASSQCLSFSDRMEYLPAILTSFTTPGDPVIQELAGRMSGRADGAAAAATNADAAKFLRSLYEWLTENHVSYQSPARFVNGSDFGQHIKYGRDVLRNHAGTCVDLAILWASTCEAAGLRPVLIVTPGHCFPAVYLPEGQLVPIEATGIGKCNFDKAVEIGVKEFNESRQGESIQVDVLSLRKLGIQGLDLPSASPTFLTDVGYRFDSAAQTQNVSAQNSTFKPVSNQDNQSENQPAPSIVGLWQYTGPVPVGNVDLGLALVADGRMALCVIMPGANGQQVTLKSVGHWQVEGNILVLTSEEGTNRFRFQLQGHDLAVYFPGLKATVHLHRVRQS